MQLYIAKGSFGGGRSSFHSTSHVSSKSSTSKSSSPKSTSSKKSTSTKTASKPKVAKQSTKPGSTIKTASGKKVKTSTAKPTNKSFNKEKGIVGANGYQPHFTNGYTAPAGSVVYYPNHSALDYLPWIYLFSLSNDSPRNDQAVIVQPDGKQVAAKPEQGGIDGMFILNWVILVLFIATVIAGIVYLVNKFTSRNEN